jgi:hypothetical protein
MKDRIDELLDSALATYVESPRPGLEQRIMYRVRARRHPWRLIVPAFALVALACVALFFPRPRTSTSRERHSGVQARPAPQVSETPTGSIHRKRLLAKQATFPMATPLTEGERALLALGQQHPETAVDVAANLKKANSDLPEIEPLEIPPLRPETGQ